MKKKLFIALYTSLIVIAVVLLNVVVTTIKRNPSVPPSPEEVADTSIAQFDERPNATIAEQAKRSFYFLSFLFPRTEALASSCALRFAFVPKVKAVEPRGEVSYDITISNHGKEACENVSLSLYYTEHESFVSSDPSPTASDYYWAVGSLGSGKTRKLSLTTKTTMTEGQFTSEACATADNSSDLCAQNIIFVEEGASKKVALAGTFSVPSVVGAIWGRLFNKKEFAIWVWDSPIRMTQTHAGRVISISKRNGFNTIYLTVDDYLRILDIRDKEERETEKKNYMEALAAFIRASATQDIRVKVVGGAKDWALEENRWKGYALIDFVQEYNQKYPKAQIVGLQYDVEPYLLSDYDYDKKRILREFVEFVDESARRMKDMDTEFSIVIPHFYDSEQKWTPSFLYKRHNDHTFTHLLRALKQKENTAIIIMSYRNFFEESNGTKQISEAEFKEASAGGYTTKIILAQETGNVSPSYVTFYDYPKVSLFDALSEIQSYFGKYENFGGVAVHYFDSFLKME